MEFREQEELNRRVGSELLYQIGLVLKQNGQTTSRQIGAFVQMDDILRRLVTAGILEKSGKHFLLTSEGREIL